MDGGGPKACEGHTQRPRSQRAPRRSHGRVGRRALQVEPRAGGVTALSRPAAQVQRAAASLPASRGGAGLRAQRPRCAPLRRGLEPAAPRATEGGGGARAPHGGGGDANLRVRTRNRRPATERMPAGAPAAKRQPAPLNGAPRGGVAPAAERAPRRGALQLARGHCQARRLPEARGAVRATRRGPCG
eukprot:scaffold108436_cov60-Phaeocystis_antarctica.AAC.2